MPASLASAHCTKHREQPHRVARPRAARTGAQAPLELSQDSGSSRLGPLQTGHGSKASQPQSAPPPQASSTAQQQRQQPLPSHQQHQPQQQQQQQPAHSGSTPLDKPGQSGPEPVSDEAKREARMQRNRESAQLSRQRKKARRGAWNASARSCRRTMPTLLVSQLQWALWAMI